MIQVLDVDGPLLWDSSVGRGFRLHGADPASPGIQLRTDRWKADRLHGIWCWHRASLRVPGGVFAPDLTQTGPSGPAYRFHELPSPLLSILDRINDARSGHDLLDHTRGTEAHLEQLQRRLCTHDVAALQIRPRPPRSNDPSIRTLPVVRVSHHRTVDQHDEDGRTSLTTYHQESITDGRTHFDDRETTVAHAFGVPHPGLDDQRYGERLRNRLRALDWPVDGPVLEVGCGTGELALGWGRPSNGRYRRIDLSPELLRTQNERVPWSDGQIGDLLDLPVDDDSVPLLICNEVLADLPAVPCSSLDAQTAKDVERFGLPPTEGFYNPGTFRALEQAFRVLKPGGHAVFTEFGVIDGDAIEADQLDHPEVAIHFGHASHVAHQLGFEASVVRLDDLLGVRLNATQLSRVSWRALRAWTHRHGTRIASRAWTPKTLAAQLPDDVQRLQWVSLRDEGPGPLVTRFWALLLHKPLEPAAQTQWQG